MISPEVNLTQFWVRSERQNSPHSSETVKVGGIVCVLVVAMYTRSVSSWCVGTLQLFLQKHTSNLLVKRVYVNNVVALQTWNSQRRGIHQLRFQKRLQSAYFVVGLSIKGVRWPSRSRLFRKVATQAKFCMKRKKKLRKPEEGWSSVKDVGCWSPYMTSTVRDSSLRTPKRLTRPGKQIRLVKIARLFGFDVTPPSCSNTKTCRARSIWLSGVRENTMKWPK